MEGYLKIIEEKLKGGVKELLIKKIKSEKRTFIGDTTLRDGEQAPGASLSIKEKLEIAQQLDRLGVDSIEAGFPISSKQDFEAVRLVSQKVRRPVITALCRCKKEDITCAKDALKGARRWGLALFVGTSPMLRKYSLNKTGEQIIDIVKDAILYAKKYTDNIAFAPEDASRTEPEFLYQVYNTAIGAGALVVGFTDTVGCLIPDEVEDVIRGIRENVHNLDKAFLGVHFHDDLGLAVANALAAIKNGVNIIQCTINGIGERAGNTSLEEVVIALKTKKDYYKARISINIRELYKTSQLVSKLTGLKVSANKAIVGESVFATEAGIHQAALLKSRITYEIIKPQDVGQDGTKFILGRHSGKHALINRIKELGFNLPKSKMDENNIESIYRRFKEVAGTKKIVTDSDLNSIIKEVIKGEQ